MRKRIIERMVDYDINQAELENNLSKGLTIDFETADRIVILALREHLDYLQSEQQEIESMDSVPGYKHADYYANHEIIGAIQQVLAYYGE